MQTFSARLAAVTDLTADVRLVRLDLLEPPAIDFVAGQFVSFSIPMPGARFLPTRPYSIVSAPSEERWIELLFNLVPGGPGSTYLYSLRVGDDVSFRGPAGNFVLQPYPDRRLLFVATQTGIAPLRSMVLTGLPRSRPVHLIWGLRHEDDRYFQAELAALAARHGEFTYTVVLSHPSVAWSGDVGRVHDVLNRTVDGVDDLAVYVCGGSAMIAAVVSLIRARGDCPVHKEQYYRSLPGAEE